MSRIDTIEWANRCAFALVGLLHIVPALGLLGRSTLERAYGVQLESGSLLVLMQHRALLFGLLAVACLLAAWLPSWRLPVGAMALASMLGFVAIANMHNHNATVARIVWVDAAAALVLVVAILLQWLLAGGLRTPD
jgi:hypothetical protein